MAVTIMANRSSSGWWSPSRTPGPSTSIARS
jgi:hypothetical protein